MDYEWEADNVSPYRLIPFKQALLDLDLSEDSLLRLLAANGLSVVQLSTRKRAVMAKDLVALVNGHKRPASSYAVTKAVQHAG